MGDRLDFEVGVEEESFNVFIKGLEVFNVHIETKKEYDGVCGEGEGEGKS